MHKMEEIFCGELIAREQINTELRIFLSKSLA